MLPEQPGGNFGEQSSSGIEFSPIFRHVPKISKKLLLASSCVSVRPSAWNNSAPTGRAFMKIDI